MARFTTLERRVWEWVYRRFEDGLGAPSVREIALGVNYGHTSIPACLRSLEAKGALTLYYTGERIQARGIARVRPPAWDEKGERFSLRIDSVGHDD